MERFGTNPELSRLTNTLKRELRDEYNLLQTLSWNKAIEDIEHQNNPQHFWRGIKKLSGNTKKPMNYILNDHNQKLDEDHDIETEFRNYYTNIYKDIDPPQQQLRPTKH